jgi:hypothetical protein
LLISSLPRSRYYCVNSPKYRASLAVVPLIAMILQQICVNNKINVSAG